MPHYSSYFICGMPRSGSTLLCEMLAATGVSGRPNSYYRHQSIAHWADRWNVPQTDGTDDAAFDRAYLAAMLHTGRNDTGIFGMRIMWESVAEASRRLNRIYGEAASVAAQFDRAFGQILYLHLSRGDKVAQAISLLRAEQSGLWHLAADGSVLEGTSSPQPTAYDEPRLTTLVEQLHHDDAAWDAFFSSHAIEPLRLTYETLTADPQQGLATILAALGQDSAIAKSIPARTAKLAEGESQQWAERFRKATGLGA